jgi:hypothetical protein
MTVKTILFRKGRVSSRTNQVRRLRPRKAAHYGFWTRALMPAPTALFFTGEAKEPNRRDFLERPAGSKEIS